MPKFPRIGRCSILNCIYNSRWPSEILNFRCRLKHSWLRHWPKSKSSLSILHTADDPRSPSNRVVSTGSFVFLDSSATLHTGAIQMLYSSSPSTVSSSFELTFFGTKSPDVSPGRCIIQFVSFKNQKNEATREATRSGRKEAGSLPPSSHTTVRTVPYTAVHVEC